MKIKTLLALLLLALPVAAAPKPRYLGVASWYGRSRQGREMADGDRFDFHALTAASWYFPFGTQLLVRNLANDNTVVVTVTDRGPAPRLHRLIDLSYMAAVQLGYLQQGVTHVFVMPFSPEPFEPAAIDEELIEPTY